MSSTRPTSRAPKAHPARRSTCSPRRDTGSTSMHPIGSESWCLATSTVRESAMLREPMPSFHYEDLLPLSPDETPYRLVTKDWVSTFDARGKTFLEVDPEALTKLTSEAMRDIAHLLRPGHLAQL